MKRIALHFAYNKALIALAKEAGGSWSHSKRCWQVADGSASLKKVYATFRGHATVHGDTLLGEPTNLRHSQGPKHSNRQSRRPRRPHWALRSKKR